MNPPRISLHKDSGSESPSLQHAAMGAAAVSPFLGMMGKRGPVKDPYVNLDIPRLGTIKALEALAKPGDVVLTGNPDPDMWKYLSSPFSGSDFHHAISVVENDNGQAMSTTAGMLSKKPKGTTADKLRDSLKSIKTHMRKEEAKNAVLLRPKAELRPDQIAELQKLLVEGSQENYSMGRAVRSVLHDLFVPKLNIFNRGSGGKICKDNICSTLPAQAYEKVTGHSVVPNVPSKFTSPADYLRADSVFDPVAARIVHDSPLDLRGLKLRSIGARGLVGLSLAGGAYGLSEDPAAALIPAGLVASPILGRYLAKQYQMRQVPDVPAAQKADLMRRASRAGHNTFRPYTQLLDAIGGETRKRRAVRKNILTRTAPLSAAGAAALYFGGSKLVDAIRSRDDS